MDWFVWVFQGVRRRLLDLVKPAPVGLAEAVRRSKPQGGGVVVNPFDKNGS